MIRVDKFLIEELQKAGLDIDFKGFKELYHRSRQHPECQARKRRNEREKRLYAEVEAKYGSIMDEAFNQDFNP